MSEAFVILPVIGANTVYVLHSWKLLSGKSIGISFVELWQRSRMQRCIKEKSNVRRYYVDAKLEQWSVSLECFKYKTPYLLEALSARVAFKLFPWRVLPFLGYTTLESSTIGIVKGVYISNLHHSGEHEPLKIL